MRLAAHHRKRPFQFGGLPIPVGCPYWGQQEMEPVSRMRPNGGSRSPNCKFSFDCARPCLCLSAVFPVGHKPRDLLSHAGSSICGGRQHLSLSMSPGNSRALHNATASQPRSKLLLMGICHAPDESAARGLRCLYCGRMDVDFALPNGPGNGLVRSIMFGW